MRQREAQLRYRAALLLATALALAAVASPARAEAIRFGDIAVTSLPVPSCDSLHGYVEYRFAVENRSVTQPHEVRIALPEGGGREGAALSEISRAVVVAPGATVTVSVPQCGLSMQGDGAAVSIDGRRQRETLRVGIENHGCGRYMSRPANTLCVILASRGVPFPAPGEKDPFNLARAEQDVREWSAEWLAYSRFDGIIIASDEMERMPPPVRLAIIRYVECGGTLQVVGDWKPPPEWGATDPSSAAARAFGLGFGVCVVNTQTGYTASDPSRLLSVANDTAAPLRNVRSVEDANREFPVVEDIRLPVRGMLVLMLAFVIVIGPVNLFILSRLNKRIWLLVTVPLIALLTGGLMFGYSIVSEGFEGHCRTATLTLLDETTGRATSLGWAAYYSPLATREGLHFSYQTELNPQISADRGYSYRASEATSGNRTVDWTEDQHLASGWLAARVPVHFTFRKSEVRRERLAVHTGAGGKITVVNGLGVPIKQLTLADREGRFHEAENIPAGAEVALEPLDIKAGATENLRNLYKGVWLPIISDRARTQRTCSKPLTYIAVLDGSPFTDNAMPAAREQGSIAVVYGIGGGRADGN